MRIGIAGLAGRMGQMIAEECLSRRIAVAGGIVRPGELTPEGFTVFEDVAHLVAECDVLVDFTSPAAVAGHAWALAHARCAWVLGTTGLTGQDQAQVDQAASVIPVVQAANFSPGVTLVLALARELAHALPAEDYDAEIIEMHHRQKLDAPSGTALALGRAVAAGRGADPAEALQTTPDRTGARRTGSIGFASQRAGQVVGRHGLLFAGTSEHITLTHEALDRRVFAAGAVRAALWLPGRPAGIYGMNDVLGITPAP